MKLIFAIGNPGKKYENTYHNLGILFAKYLISKNIILDNKDSSLYSFIKLKNFSILISKVFMNNSANALKEIYEFYKIENKNLLVMHDELSLKKFDMQLKFTQGLGGHNGLRSIAQMIGTDFARLKIGIDHPKNFAPLWDVADYVLSQLNYDEWQKVFEKNEMLITKWLEI